MKKLVIVLLLFGVFSCSIKQPQESCNCEPYVSHGLQNNISTTAATLRYRDKVFSSVTVVSNVVYATETLKGSTVNLKADIYYPAGDNATNRWWITNAHGNTKTKTSSEVVSFCKEMAKYGYVVINIDYREPNGDAQYEDLIYCGADQRNAVRFMRKNAATYKIDPNKMSVFGGSQGGYGAMYSAYAPLVDTLSVSHAGWSGQPNLCAESAGLVHPSEFNHGEPPLFMMHCTGDPLGTFDEAQTVFQAALDSGIVATNWWKTGTCHSFYNCCLTETASRLSAWIYGKLSL